MSTPTWLYRDQEAQEAATLPAFIPLKVEIKRKTEMLAIIKLPLGHQTLTVKPHTPTLKVAPDSSVARSMIRIDSISLATEPMDMRADTETALARVVAVFGAAKPHCAYLFASSRATRMKVLLYDGFGIWLTARGLNQRKLHWQAFEKVAK
jgi:hypothetical protein